MASADLAKMTQKADVLRARRCRSTWVSRSRSGAGIAGARLTRFHGIEIQMGQQLPGPRASGLPLRIAVIRL
jgi:hypothetical protein